MPEIKNILTNFLSGQNVYLNIKQRSTGFYFDDTDGAYRLVPALLPHILEIEPQKYLLQDNRTIWTDDIYEVGAFVQAGIAENLVTDLNISNGELSIKDDKEVLNTDLKTDTETILTNLGLAQADLVTLLANLALIQIDTTNILAAIAALSINNLVAIYAEIKKLTYYSDTDSIVVYAKDTIGLRFLFKDILGNEFTPDPLKDYYFGVKKNLNDITFLIPKSVMAINGNYLEITINPQSVNKGLWEVIQDDGVGQFTLKSSGYYESRKNII